jgi:hypothetical protein
LYNILYHKIKRDKGGGGGGLIRNVGREGKKKRKGRRKG